MKISPPYSDAIHRRILFIFRIVQPEGPHLSSSKEGPRGSAKRGIPFRRTAPDIADARTRHQPIHTPHFRTGMNQPVLWGRRPGSLSLRWFSMLSFPLRRCPGLHYPGWSNRLEL